jgi:hypothetical protein
MKRAITLLILTFALSTVAAAQNISAADSAVLNHILTANQQFHSIQNTFRHDLLKPKKNISQQRYGTLYYEQLKPAKHGDTEAKIAMRYSKPEGEYYIITSTNLYNGIDGHKLNFNYRFVPLMKLLGNSLAWAMNGDIYSICTDLNTNFQMATTATHHVITLSITKGDNTGIT